MSQWVLMMCFARIVVLFVVQTRKSIAISFFSFILSLNKNGHKSLDVGILKTTFCIGGWHKITKTPSLPHCRREDNVNIKTRHKHHILRITQRLTLPSCTSGVTRGSSLANRWIAHDVSGRHLWWQTMGKVQPFTRARFINDDSQCKGSIDFYRHGAAILPPPLQTNVTKPRLERKIVWFLKLRIETITQGQ